MWLRAEDGLDLQGKLFFFDVVGAWRLPEPRHLEVGARRQFFRFDHALARDFLAHARESGAAIPEWLVDIDIEDYLSSIGLHVPASYATLIASTRWPSIAALHYGRFSIAVPGGPFFHTLLDVPDVVPADGGFTSALAYAVGQELRTMLTNLDPADADVGDRRQGIQSMIAQLQVTSDELTREMMMNMSTLVSGGATLRRDAMAYKASFLIQCVCLSHAVHDSKNLSKVLQRAVTLALPPSLARVITACLLDGSIRVPSKATLSRSRIAVDVAFMSWHRMRSKRCRAEGGGAVRYIMMDSSPQGHHNYELIQQTSVLYCDLWRAYDLAQSMAIYWQGRRPADNGMEDFRDELHKIDELTGMIQVHALPVVVIGSGRGNVAAKFHSLVHAMLLESPSLDVLCENLAEVQTFTSDQGVEFSIAGVRPIDLARVFPWMPEAAPPILMDGDEDWEEPVANRLRVDLSGSVPVAGLLHIIHNSSSGLEAVMQTYTETVDKVGLVCNLLRKRDSKMRLLSTCFVDGVARHMRQGLEQFSSHVHSERWGTVARAATDLVAVEHSLRFGWDLNRYRGGGGGPDRVKLEVIDQAINSDMFWGSLRPDILIANL